MKAIWNDTTIAESNETVVIENNHYFPLSSVKMEYFEKTDTNTVCPWKGTASYYSVKVNNEINEDAAWYYPTPTNAAEEIKNHVAFWKGIQITE